MPAIRIREYLDPHGRSPWGEWFESLSSEVAAKVALVIYRMGEGNFSNVKGVGAGVFERVLDWGPGYRVYFGKDGETIVILLGGSSKKHQQQAIEEARDRWADYRRRKTKG
jgi:putative addiction module killer protein